MSRTREERSSRSKYFDWLEEAPEGNYWTGSRNELVIMRITYMPLRVDEDGRPYELQSHLPGQSGFTQGFPTVKEAMDKADTRWEDWVYMMGLSQATEWWKA